MPEAIYAVDFVEYMSAALNLQKPYISSNSLVKFLYSALILPKILQKILRAQCLQRFDKFFILGHCSK